jgi:ketosteroid isomerase-like protein
MAKARRAAVALFGLVGVLFLITSCALGPSGAPLSGTAAERELRALHEQWARARIDGDVAFLERFYGEELRLNVMNGAVTTRAQDIALFDRKGKDLSQVIIPEFLQDDELSFAVYGNTAVVTGVETLRGRAMGNYGEMALRFTNVLVRREGRWQLVHHQSTSVQRR